MQEWNDQFEMSMFAALIKDSIDQRYGGDADVNSVYEAIETTLAECSEFSFFNWDMLQDDEDFFDAVYEMYCVLMYGGQ